jgi:transcriptional regulator with XRE-family HTH domain
MPARSPLHTVLSQAVVSTGRSQRELSQHAGFSESTISTLLGGKNLGRIDTWDRLLRAADVEVTFRRRGTAPTGFAVYCGDCSWNRVNLISGAVAEAAYSAHRRTMHDSFGG